MVDREKAATRTANEGQFKKGGPPSPPIATTPAKSKAAGGKKAKGIKATVWEDADMPPRPMGEASDIKE